MLFCFVNLWISLALFNILWKWLFRSLYQFFARISTFWIIFYHFAIKRFQAFVVVKNFNYRLLNPLWSAIIWRNKLWMKGSRLNLFKRVIFMRSEEIYLDLYIWIKSVFYFNLSWIWGYYTYLFMEIVLFFLKYILIKWWLIYLLSWCWIWVYFFRMNNHCASWLDSVCHGTFRK